ncbi:MAG: hypothetical protein Q9227_006067 [Pyrenula ochraceoflavens]
MPSKVRDSDRNRAREASKQESTKSEKKSSKSSHRKVATKDRERHSDRSSTSTPPSDPKRRSSMPGSLDTKENTQPSSSLDSKTSLPYPTFSKAHSKEAIGARDAIRPKLNVFTPDPTDLDESRAKASSPRVLNSANAPPSPPLTSVDEKPTPKTASRNKNRPEVDTILEEKDSSVSERFKAKLRPKSTRSAGDLKSRSDVARSPSPEKPRSKPVTPLRVRVNAEPKSQRSASQPLRPSSPAGSNVTTTETVTVASSDATSIAPNQPSNQPPLSQNTPLQNGSTERKLDGHADPRRSKSPIEVFIQDGPGSSVLGAGPPPPPPPPIVPTSVPRVDYLLQNGGLMQPVSKNLLHAGKPMSAQHYVNPPYHPPAPIADLFGPYNRLLEDYSHVMEKSGSVAVATGYRSVARRLLDRLEAVFARDISSEACRCCMCGPANDLEDVRGVSWGEILELVSGRRELPLWPPFSFDSSPVGLGISLENHVPMQKLDIDVPEEWREHYLKQSKRTKQTVDKWLARQVDGPTSPPSEVDDDTLTFAILTHLGPEERPTFSNLLGIVQTPLEAPKRAPSPHRGPTPQPSPAPTRPRSEPIVTAGRAIQRLYRLPYPPRDPEAAIYLLYNPALHDTLATLAEITDDEWDILTSGRFDGFLRSGAEDMPPATTRHSPFRSASARQPTPLGSNGRSSVPPRPSSTNPNPASYGAPIAFDEETEIATLAEVEREIYQGMEALEDAFEALHLKAETVRRALRERSVGLTVAASRRRGGGVGGGIEVRMGTPASGVGDNRWEGETDDGMGTDWDGVSELAPDDSASNVSSSRRRRPKRRNERRTPAMVEEEDETSEGTASPKKR